MRTADEIKLKDDGKTQKVARSRELLSKDRHGNIAPYVSGPFENR